MNLVITISRRFGTGASLIAQELSEKLGVPVYDKAYIEHELDGDSYATEAEVIKELAEHPCIILGRCASEILKDQPNVFNVYVCADKEDRIERIMKKESLPHDEAKEMLENIGITSVELDGFLPSVKSLLEPLFAEKKSRKTKDIAIKEDVGENIIAGEAEIEAPEEQ